MATPASVNLAPRTAPNVFGMMFNSGLMGSLVVQVYRYYCTFPHDRNIAKAIVYTLFLAELAETAGMSYAAKRVYGSGFGNTAILNESRLTYIYVVILPTTIGLIVHLFYAYRVHSFSRSKIAAAVILLLALVAFISGIGDAIMSAMDGKLSHVSQRRMTITVWLVSGALCDSAIAAAMVFYLRRGVVVSSPMKNTISRIIRYTIATGALTAFINLLQIFITFAFPTQYYFEVMGWVIGKLYSNSLLVLLNARATTVGGRDEARRMQDIDLPTLTVIDTASVERSATQAWSGASAAKSISWSITPDGELPVHRDAASQLRWQTPVPPPLSVEPRL